MSSILILDKVSFQYDKHNLVLNNVNFEVFEGEFVAVIGPNGSGKSTLLKLILNELFPTSGQIKIFDSISSIADYQDVEYVAQNVGMVYQNVLANVAEIVKSSLFINRRNSNLKLDEVLDMVDLKKHKYTLIDQLSGGQQQRVAIAKALITNPKLLILDEPTAGIDKETSNKLYALLHQLTLKGITVVMVTHDLAECVSYIDRTLCVEKGNVCELTKLEVEQELSHKHIHPEVD